MQKAQRSGRQTGAGRAAGQIEDDPAAGRRQRALRLSAARTAALFAFENRPQVKPNKFYAIFEELGIYRIAYRMDKMILFMIG